MNGTPEAVLQFGAGNFLRAFVDLFVHHANQREEPFGSVVVVQSTGGDRVKLIRQTAGRYHVAVRGFENGAVVDRVEECASISRALAAQSQWDEVLRVARSPALRYVVSNTTEAGYAVHDAERFDESPPRSFPAKLLAVLHARWQAGLPPLAVMPCELIEDNAVRLRGIVRGLAVRWKLPAEFIDWLGESCDWLSSLVDRIVPGRPNDHPLSATDPLLLMAEPYALWALEARAGTWFNHPAIVRPADVKPYFLRKVRILNAAHTALVCRVGDRFETVLDAMHDAETVAWLERLLFDEIVPTVNDRVDDAKGFARQTLERFRNPFLRHRLADIALHHGSKKAVRLQPTAEEYERKFGRKSKLLNNVLGEP